MDWGKKGKAAKLGDSKQSSEQKKLPAAIVSFFIYACAKIETVFSETHAICSLARIILRIP